VPFHGGLVGGLPLVIFAMVSFEGGVSCSFVVICLEGDMLRPSFVVSVVIWPLPFVRCCFLGGLSFVFFCSGCLLGAWSVVPVVAFLESGLSLSSLWFRGRFPRPFLVVLVVCGFDAFVSGCAVGGRMVAWAMFSRGLSFSLLSIDILTLREAYKHATVG